MTYLVFLDDGHGMETSGKRTPYISSLGRQIKEKEFNQPVVDLIKKELERHNVICVDVAPGDSDVSLVTRTNKANHVYQDYARKYGKENIKSVYVSIHFNAFDGTFSGRNPEGFSVHVYPGHKFKDAGKLGQYVIRELVKGTRQVNRGIVEQDLHVLRETQMPAILTENGFMDNEREALLMIDKEFQREVALEHTKGILSYFNIPYKSKEVKPVEKKVEELEKHWAYPHIKKVKEAGVMNGYPDGTFRPDSPVTRAELARVISKLLER